MVPYNISWDGEAEMEAILKGFWGVGVYICSFWKKLAKSL